MSEEEWTPSLVEARIVEAVDVLTRLPETRVQGYYSTWPGVMPEFSDLVGRNPPRLKRPPPSPAAISRMEETLEWPKLLEPRIARIIWLRAAGERWKTICWTVGLQRAAAHETWLYGLCLIALRLNRCRFNRNLSKRRVIALARASQQ